MLGLLATGQEKICCYKTEHWTLVKFVISYHKNSENWDTYKITIIVVINGTVWFYNAVISLKDAAGMANNVDIDQTALLRAV
ncbi:MAG: hypothetical protein AB2693_22545 [Candidatus Thiodiazotropha sp.]